MTEKTVITDSEFRVLKAIFANFYGKPNVNWEAAAADASLGNVRSIKERYRQMCIRLGWNYKTGTGNSGGVGSGNGRKKQAGGGINPNPNNSNKVVKRSGGGVKKRTTAAKEGAAERHGREMDSTCRSEETDDGGF